MTLAPAADEARPRPPPVVHARAGITLRRQVSPGEGRVLDVQQWGGGAPLMTYATQRGGVHGRDLRMQRDAWVVPAPPRLGLLQQASLSVSCYLIYSSVPTLDGACRGAQLQVPPLTSLARMYVYSRRHKRAATLSLGLKTLNFTNLGEGSRL